MDVCRLMHTVNCCRDRLPSNVEFDASFIDSGIQRGNIEVRIRNHQLVPGYGRFNLHELTFGPRFASRKPEAMAPWTVLACPTSVASPAKKSVSSTGVDSRLRAARPLTGT